MTDHSELIVTALERGKAWLAELLESDEMLSGPQIARQLGISLQELEAAVDDDRILVLGPPASRRYPRWQVVHGGPIPQLPEISAYFADSVSLYLFLRTSMPLLENIPPI